MEKENIVGLAAGILTAVCMIPQLVQVIRKKDGQHLSPFMLSLLLGGLGLWIWYGALKKDLPVLLTNSFSATINLTLLVCCLLFGNKKKTRKT